MITDVTGRQLANNLRQAELPSAPAPLLSIGQSGRCVELAIDTGHLLRSGRTWMAYARIPCANVFAARLLTDNLRRRLADAIADARREAYEEGYQSALAGLRPRSDFAGEI